MPRRFAIILIAIAALGIRLWLAPTRGHIHDIEQFKTWADIASSSGLVTIYSQSTANYPPLALLPLSWMGEIYRALSPEFDLDSRWLTVLIKIPPIVADLATASIIYRLVQRKHDDKMALTCATAYALNPAVWYLSSWWGQWEALYTLPMLLSISSLVSKRSIWAWLWLAVAVLVKPQAAMIAPVLLAASWQQGRWRRILEGGVAFSGAIAVVLAPWLFSGQFSYLWAHIRASVGNKLFLSMNAHNIWFLVTRGRGSFAAREGYPLYDTEPLLGPFTGWQIGLLLLGGWCALVFLSVLRQKQWGNRTAYWYLASVLAVGFFMLPTESHERYLFPVLALMAPILPEYKLARWFYGILSLCLFLNLIWVDPAIPLPFYAERLAWGIPGSLLNTGVLIVMGGQLLHSIGLGQSRSSLG